MRTYTLGLSIISKILKQSMGALVGGFFLRRETDRIYVCVTLVR